MCIKERCKKQRWAQHEEGSAVVIELLREKISDQKSIKTRAIWDIMQNPQEISK